MDDEIFLWNWKISPRSSYFFWFDTDERGRFGYRMENDPEHFELWEEHVARDKLHEFTKHSIRNIYGPLISEIPPLIWKIRRMEQRHNRFLERKYNAI